MLFLPQVNSSPPECPAGQLSLEKPKTAPPDGHVASLVTFECKSLLCHPDLLTLRSSGNWMAKKATPCPDHCIQLDSHLSGYHCLSLCWPWSLMAFPSPQGQGYAFRRVLTYMPPPLIASTQSYYCVDSSSGLPGHLPTRPYGLSQVTAPNLTAQEQGQA